MTLENLSIRTKPDVSTLPKGVATSIVREFGNDGYRIERTTKPSSNLSEYTVITDEGVMKTFDDQGVPFRVTKNITPKKETLSEAVKFDGGKARYDLIPADALHALAQTYAMGANKYDDRNWELGLDYSRIYAAMQRHAWAWWRGEERDQEDGQPHLASVAWCALALLAFELRGNGKDDRPA